MPQIKTTTSAWADVYALSGIAPGTALLVQNQSGNLAILQQSATAPNVNDNTGRWLQSGVEAVVDAGATGLWIRCSPSGVTAYVQGGQRMIRDPGMTQTATQAMIAKLPVGKRIESYVGVTDANGLFTVTYPTAFPAVPSVQPGPPADSTQSWVLVSSTATGFSVRLVQRAVLTVVSVQVLAGVVTNVAAAPAQVLVVAQ